jgi:hypothetical protein
VGRKLAIGSAIIGVCSILAPGAAPAATSPLTIDSRSPSLEESDGGTRKVSLGFTNLTDAEITLSAKPVEVDQGCNLTLDKPTLPGSEHTAVAVAVPAGCEVDDDGINLKVDAAAAGAAAPTTFDVTAAPKPEAKPDWDALKAFVVALIALTIAAVVMFALWQREDRERRKLTQPLEHLKDTWSFKDSWVSNVTVVGALLTGVIGSSDVVKAFLGEDAESSVALATVGAAIAAAFVAAGPIVLLSSTKGKHFTVGGLLAASVVTLTGAFGELWVVYSSGKELALDGLEDNLLIPLIVAAALLAIYAARTLVATLDEGTTKPEAGESSDTIKAAQMIVTALKGREGIAAEQMTEIDEIRETVPRHPRSALL